MCRNEKTVPMTSGARNPPGNERKPHGVPEYSCQHACPSTRQHVSTCTHATHGGVRHHMIGLNRRRRVRQIWWVWCTVVRWRHALHGVPLGAGSWRRPTRCRLAHSAMSHTQGASVHVKDSEQNLGSTPPIHGAFLRTHACRRLNYYAIASSGVSPTNQIVGARLRRADSLLHAGYLLLQGLGAPHAQGAR